MDRLTCTDADTRRAYSRLLGAQIATEVAVQLNSLDYMAHVLTDYRSMAASAAQLCRKFSRSRTAHRPTVHASTF